MPPYVPYALKIWFCSVLLGSIIFVVTTSLIDGEGINKLGDLIGLFLILILFIVISIFRSIPAFFILIYVIIAAQKFTKKMITFKFLMCIISYLLCFATLYLFFIRNKPFPNNLKEPMLWQAFFSYSIGLTLGVLYWFKRFNRDIKVEETEL